MITRRPGAGQTIKIGENIKILVGRINAWGSVEICIEAPREIKIVRGELLERARKDGAA